MRKAIVAMIIGLLALGGSAVLSAAPASADVVDSGMEAAFVAKINALRASKGLGGLAVHSELVGIARNWAQAMANANQISHNPNFPNQVSANWRKLGENVGTGGNVDVLFNAFVNSPAHYENLVDPAFNNVGVGVVIKNGVIYTSHQFMQLGAASAPAAAPAPKPAAAPKAAAAPRTTTPRPAAAPRTPTPRAAAAAAPAPVAAPAPPPPPPVPPARLVQSLAQLQGLGPA